MATSKKPLYSDEEDEDFDKVWDGQKQAMGFSTIDRHAVCILKPMYGGLAFIGMCLIVMGIVFINPFVTELNKPSTALIIGGLFMIALGVVGLLALRGARHRMLVGVEVLNIILFAFFVAGAMLALSLATGTGDPITRAVKDGWRLEYGRDESEKHGYCQKFGGAKCAKFYMQVQTFGADQARCGVHLHPWDSKYRNNAAKGTYKNTWDCLQINANATVDCKEQGSLAIQCEDCDLSCQDAAIMHIKEHLQPAAIAVYCTAVYLVLTLVWNNHMLHIKEAEGRVADHEHGANEIIGYILNFVVCACGIAITVLGFWGYSQAATECEHVVGGCTSMSAVGLGIAGIFLALIGAVAIAAIKWDTAIRSTKALKVIDFAYSVLTLVLIVLGIGLGVAAGLVKEVNAEFDMVYNGLLKQYKSQDHDYCMDLSHEACYDKLKADVKGRTEGSLGTIAIVISLVAFYIVLLIYFTERAITLDLASGGVKKKKKKTQSKKQNNPMNSDEEDGYGGADSRDVKALKDMNTSLEAQVNSLKLKLAVSADDTNQAKEDLEDALTAAIDANDDAERLKNEIKKLRP